MTPETRCQCSRWEVKCTIGMTQEDLLCDTCRAGCWLMEILPDLGICPHMGPLKWSLA